MKKFLQMMLLAALMVPIGARAQSLTVGDGSSANSYVPFYGLWMDAAQHNQIIYAGNTLADMENMYINTLSWYLSSSASSAWTSSVTIKMGVVTDSVLTTAFVSTDDFATVWTGNIDATSSLINLILDTAFLYEGGNLLIDITTTSGNYSSASFYGISTSTAHSHYSYNSTNSTQNFLPKTTFGYNATGYVCYPPSALAIDTITSTYVTFHWSAGGEETSWYVSLDGNNWTPVSDSTYTFGATSDDDEGALTPNTAYTIYVASACGDDTSMAIILNARTACGTIAVYPWTAGFEGESDTPSCWTNISGGTSASNSTTNSHTGDNYLRFSGSYVNAIAFPPVDREWNQLHLNFWTRPESNTSSCGSFSVGYYTDITNAETFVALETYNYNEFGSTATYMEKDVALDSVPDGAVLAFRHNSNATYYYWYVDDVTLSIPATCDRPTAVTFSEIGTTSLEVTITGDEDGNYQLYLYNNDTIVDSAMVASLTHTFTDLLPGKYYTVSVAAVCDDGGVTLPITNSALTNCLAYDTLPIIMDFDNVITGSYSQWFDPCWHKGGVSTSSTALFPYVTSGYLYSYTYYDGDYNWFMFPALGEDIEINTLELSFDARTYSYTGYTGSFVVGLIDAPVYNDTVEMDTIATFSLNNMTFEQQFVSFLGYNGEKRNIVFVIRSSENQIDNNNSNYVYVDNISLHAAPTCSRPMNLTIEGMTNTTATISWTSDAAGFEYTLEYPGNDTTEFITVTTTDTFAVLTGMVMDTDYVFTVRGICDDANSDWMSISFHQGYCIPAPISVDNDGITEVVFGVAPEQVDNDSLSPASSPYYGNYSDMVGAVPAGTECAVDITYQTSYTYGTIIWVDWNNNMQFEGNEVVYVGTSSSANPTTLNALFTVPASQDTGYYRMRIAGADSYYDSYTSSIAAAANANPCPNSSYTIVHDYTLHVTEAPACLTPSNLAATPDATSITLSFDGGSSTSFNVMWTDGTTDGSAAITASPYTITGLTPLTTYTISIYTNCAEGNSDTATLTATTLMLPATLPYTTGFEAGQDVAWAMVNSSNGWFIGSATNNGGSHSLYVSDNNGTANSYNTSNTSFSYAYKLFTFDTAQYGISFDWKGYGESSWDYLRAWLAPASFVFTAGQTPSGTTSSSGYTTTTPAGWIDLGGKMNLASEWQFNQAITNINAGNYYLVFMWANDGSSGTNPPAAIDNIVVRQITCVAPDSLDIDTVTENSVTLSWQPAGDETSWEVVVGATSTIVNAIPATITGLNAGTYYTAKVRAVCGAGDSSFFSTIGFYTECIAAETVPFKETFDALAFPHCWKDTVIGVSSTTWSTGMYHSDNLSYIYSSAPDDYQYNNWLISPAVAIPATDTTMLRIAYQVAGLPNSTAATARASYMLLVSPTGSDALTAFTDTLLVDTLNNNVFQNMYFPVGQYAGQNIRIAVRNTSFNYGTIYLNEIGVRYVNEPLFGMGGHGTVYVGDTNAYYGRYIEGDLSTMTYSWTSTMVAAGQATMTDATTDTMHIVYNATGVDTLMFVATNAYGSDTTRGIVHVFSLNPVTMFPYTTGFESENTDNFSWIMYNGSNAWAIGSATAAEGTQSLYISNDGGATNAYTVTNATVSFVARAFDIANPGDYSIGFDWKAYGEGYYDYLRAFFVPDSLFHVSANNYPDGSTSSYNFRSATVPGWISLGGSLNLIDTVWTREEDSINITTPGRYHLVFLWSNDGSVGTQPPAAIDNVEVNNGSILVCDEPIILDATATETTATVTFIGEAENYELAIVEGAWTDSAVSAAVIVPLTGLEDTLFHVFTDLTANTLYTIGVRSVCFGSLISEWVTETVTTDEHPCYMPTNLAASDVTITTATLGWTIGEAETEWMVNLSSTVATLDTTFVTSTNPVTLTGLTPKTPYMAKIRAICSTTQQSDWTEAITFTTDSCRRVATAPTVSGVTSHSAVITWDAGSNSNGNYQIDYGFRGFTQGYGTRVEVTGATTYTIDGLLDGTAYDVYVRSMCATGVYSNWSPVGEFTTQTADPDECNAPTGVAVNNITANSATVTWNGTAAQYEVEYGSTGFEHGAGTVLIANGTSQSLTGLTSNTTYDVYVRSICANGNMSDWSAVKNFTTSEAQGIDDVNGSAVVLYPNPATVSVTVSGIEGQATVTIVDLNGRESGKWNVENGEITIDVSDMAKGAYFVRIVGEQSTAIRKLVIR